MLKHFASMRGSNNLKTGFGRAGIPFVLLMIVSVEAQDDCAAGQYRADGSSACTLCPAGLFSDSTTATECTKCAEGTFSRGGSSECTDCAAGQYDHDSSATTPCEPCPLHSYSESERTSGDCTPCPSEKGTGAVGANNSSLCNETAVRYPCSDFTCGAGHVQLTASSVGFPDAADDYCLGESLSLIHI